MSNFIRKQKGITLIALVITIIVLLILAGVSISMLTGENGILKQASDAKIQTEQQSVIEQIKLAYLASLTTGNGEVDTTVLASELKEISGEDVDTTNFQEKGSLKISVNGETYVLKKGGDVTIAKDLGEHYLNLLKIVFGITEASEEEYESAYEELEGQDLIYTFDRRTGIYDYSEIYIHIDGYNYFVVSDCTGSDDIITVSLLTEGSEDYNIVNSLVEESKSVEEELTTLLINSDYTYTYDDYFTNKSIATYIQEGLQEERRVECTNGGLLGFGIYVSSTVDGNVTLEYHVNSTQKETPAYSVDSITNNNAEF